MKKLFSLFACAALFVTAGCGKKQKSTIINTPEKTVVQEIAQEKTTESDKKEDYSILG